MHVLGIYLWFAYRKGPEPQRRAVSPGRVGRELSTAFGWLQHETSACPGRSVWHLVGSSGRFWAVFIGPVFCSFLSTQCHLVASAINKDSPWPWSTVNFTGARGLDPVTGVSSTTQSLVPRVGLCGLGYMATRSLASSLVFHSHCRPRKLLDGARCRPSSSSTLPFLPNSPIPLSSWNLASS